jgi:MoxR-like ATPase
MTAPTAPGAFAQLRQHVSGQVGQVVVGQQGALDHLLIALACRGHVLYEGVPGVAKTLLATAAAKALGLSFRRAQFTPDLLPSDITGTMTLRGGDLAFRPGPLFTQILLADEINRTPPKTQSALLEAMQEHQVSVDGTSHPLPQPFLVVATQNPIEHEGTYPLPEAQLDRFLLKIEIGYPAEADEVAMAQQPRRGVEASGLAGIAAAAGAGLVDAARAEVDGTHVAPEVAAYAVAVVRATRALPSVELGASPRAAVHLLAVAKAGARLAGRGFVTPDDVAWAARPTLAHRIRLRPEAELERFRAADAVGAALTAVPVPRPTT